MESERGETAVVSGASGLLGRAVVSRFEQAGWNVVGLARSRAHKNPKFVKVDLCDKPAVDKVIADTKPSVIIHCAAERNPDVVQVQPESSKRINVDATEYLAKCAEQNGSIFLYISTDSVFDGEHPPYAEDAFPKPVNEYGGTKRAGEVATLAHNGLVLRIPFLYGPVDELDESSLTILFSEVMRGKHKVLSDYDKRYATNVNDIADALLLLTEKKLADIAEVSGIYHCSATEGLTKYEMALVIAEIFGQSAIHITPDSGPPTSGPGRGRDPLMSCDRLKKLGAKKPVGFSDGVEAVLKPFANIAKLDV